MTNSERAAYIRGLMEGLELDPNAKETKLFNAIVDLLDDLCLSMEEMEDAYDELSGQVDEIDEDLGELEEDFYDLDEDEADEDDEWEDDEDDCYFEVTCPSCGDTIELNGEMLEEGSIDCPNCGEKLEFDFDDDACDCAGEDCCCDPDGEE
ncbi:MAG: CD1247 N-terminal domain-containing protein [Hominenteromicrobium sp.]